MSINKNKRIKSMGFTLVEMLLVLLLMGAVALTAALFVDNADDQIRYDETKNRLEIIKRAIVGDPTRTVNGEPEVIGFVADMGRLPECIRELVYGNCSSDKSLVTSDLQLWAFDSVAGIWSGWRGPYLDTGGLQEFRDGWGNKNADTDEDARNFGWRLSGLLKITSLGKDNSLDGQKADYTGDSSIEIDLNDYMVDLAGWDNTTLEVNYLQDDEKNLEGIQLRVVLNYPEDGQLLDGWESSPFELENARVPNLSGALLLKAGAKLTSGVSAVLTSATNWFDVPANTELSFSDGTPAPAETGALITSDKCPTTCRIVVPNHSPAVDGTYSELTFPTGSTLLIPRSFIKPISAQVSGFATRTIVARSDALYASDTLSLPGGTTVSIVGADWRPPLLKLPEGAPITATVSESFTLVGTKLTVDSTGDVIIVPLGTTNDSGNVLTIPVDAGKSFLVPIGVRSLSLVCDDGGNIFNGACPSSETSSLSTRIIKLAPRQAPPLKPNPFVWNIR